MIETTRLKIVPLNYPQLVLYIKNDNSLEKELNLNETERDISSRLAEALEKKILPKVADTSRDYLYYTLWTVILKSENKMAADLCFKGEPNEEGEVEIGYGTYPSFQNKGIISEAISGLINWIEKQQNIKVVTAQTAPTNFPSIKALEKNGFVKYREEPENILWKLFL
jgi:[ribosomal protein S5]-alanine N-acetyltransferase